MKLKNISWEDKGAYRVGKGFELSKDCFIQLVEVKPRSEVRKHYHKTQTEIFVILNGSAVLGIGDNVYEAISGEIFLCKPLQRHWVKNCGAETFRILVFKYNYSPDDTIWE